LLDRLRAVEHHHIGNTEACRPSLYAQRWPDPHIPFPRMLMEPETDGLLPSRMLVLSCGRFLNLSVHILRIGLVGGAKVDLNGNTRRTGYSSFQSTRDASANRLWRSNNTENPSLDLGYFACLVF
jgi:hypothetical protein